MKNLSPLHIIIIFVLASLLWFSGVNLLISGYDFPEPFVIERLLDGIYVLLAAVLIFYLVRTSSQQSQENERKYRDLFENNPQPMWVYDPHSLTFLDVNQAAIDFYGYTRPEFLGMTKSDIQPLNDPGALSEGSDLPSSAPGQEPLLEHLTKDKRVVYVELTSRELVFEDKPAILELCSDLTSKIQAQIQLKHQEEFLQRIFERTPTGICIANESGFFEQANSAYCRLYGYTEEELVGQHFTKIIPDEDQLTTRNLLRQMVQKDGAKINAWREWNVVNKHGEKLVVLADIIMLRGVTGGTKIITFVADITERKKAEEQIRKSEMALREAQSVAQLGSWEYWLNPPKITWSDQVFQIHGMDKEQGEPSFEEMQLLYHPDDLPAFQQLLYQAIDKGMSYNHDLRIIHPETGDIKYLNIIGQPEHNDKGQVVKLHGTLMDINERKLAEKHLQEQNEALKKINTELDRFVYSAGHDLRAPLVSVLGLINIAQLDPSPGKKDEYMQLMSRSIYKLDNFIKDIINFSRNARTEIACERIAFRELISEVIDNLNYLNVTQPVETIIEVQEDNPFCSDAKRIGIILNNLLSNALRYSDPFRENPVIIIRVEVTGKEALITVSDNGIGIEAVHLDKIFQMFYRATESRSGSGLGLFIVKETVTILEGQISVQSTLGKGTTFQLTLPNRVSIADLDCKQSATSAIR